MINHLSSLPIWWAILVLSSATINAWAVGLGSFLWPLNLVLVLVCVYVFVLWALGRLRGW